jgi:hypothetical protein
MEIAHALLAKQAKVGHTGQADILGVMRELHVTGFPHTHPNFDVAVNLAASADDKGTTREVQIMLVGPDGDTPMVFKDRVQVPEDHDSLRPLHLWRVYSLQHLRFEAPGDYEFSVLLDGVQVAELPLRMHLVKAAEPAETV